VIQEGSTAGPPPPAPLEEEGGATASDDDANADLMLAGGLPQRAAELGAVGVTGCSPGKSQSSASKAE